MPRKRKASKCLDELWGEEEEGGLGLPVETFLHEETFRSNQPTNDSQTKASKDPLQQPTGNTRERGICGAPAESEEPRSNGARNRKAKKRPRITEEARMKKLTVTCEWNMCTKEYSKVELFTSHVTEHLQVVTEPESSDGYLCQWRECGFSCSLKEELDRHVYYHAFHTKIKSMGALIMEERNEKCILDSHGRNLIPELPEPFQCLWDGCNVKFVSAFNFFCHTEAHVRSAEQDAGKGYICAWKGCSSSFSKLRGHVISHTQERTVGCPNCGALFTNHTGFLDHLVRQIPLEAQQYKCSQCSKRFPSESLLRSHLRLHINRFKCPECEWTAPYKHTVERHIVYCHKKDRPHKCLHCGRRFPFLKDLNQHLPVHSVEPAFACEFHNCAFTARYLTYLTRHIKVAHNGFAKKHYACHLCDSRYTVGSYLTKHLVKIHNLERPAGRNRFRYILDEDRLYRLQTISYESIEQETIREEEEEEEDEEAVDSPEALAYASSPASQHTEQPVLSSGASDATR